MSQQELKEKSTEILEYFYESVVEGERRNINTDSYFKSASEITFREIQKGKVNSDQTKSLINDYKQSDEYDADGDSYDDSSSEKVPLSCSVLICPIRCNHQNSGNNKDPLVPLWMPAKLNNDGTLEVPEADSPWLERDYLLSKSSSTKQESDYLLGSVEAETEYHIKNPASEISNEWVSYFEWGINLLKHFASNETFQLEVKENKVQKFTFGGAQFALDDYAYIKFDSKDTSKFTEGIQNLYDYLVYYDNTLPALLTEYCAISPPNKKQTLNSKKIQTRLSTHVGQMNGDYPLADTQRQALQHFTTLEEGQILAVNGPPGTGKTTLIQSIVANLVVEKALAGNEPPVILASSANNQAVTNIIRSFETNNVDNNLLANRWLPDPVSDYGLYCSSNKEENVLRVTLKGEGFPDKVETKDFLTKAREKLVECANNHFDISFSSIQSIRNHLHAKLNKQYNILKEGEEMLSLLKQKENKNPTLSEETLNIHLTNIQIEKEIENKQKEITNISKQFDHIRTLKANWHKEYQRLPFMSDGCIVLCQDVKGNSKHSTFLSLKMSQSLCLRLTLNPSMIFQHFLPTN